MPIYLKCADFKGGESTAEGYKDCLELDSFQFGAGIGVDSAMGAGGRRSATAASISEITAGCSLDASHGPMFQALCSGKSVAKVEIFFVKASGKDASGNDKYLTVTTENVFVSGMSLSSGGDRPSVSISLNFSKVKLEYMKADVKGTLTNGFIAGWDLSTNKAFA